MLVRPVGSLQGSHIPLVVFGRPRRGGREGRKWNWQEEKEEEMNGEDMEEEGNRAETLDHFSPMHPASAPRFSITLATPTLLHRENSIVTSETFFGNVRYICLIFCQYQA